MMRERVSLPVVPLLAGLLLTATVGHAQDAEGPSPQVPVREIVTTPSQAASDSWIDACVPGSFPACTSASDGCGLEGDFVLFHARGRRELVEDRLEEAIADFTDALRLNPHDACTYYLRALAYRRSKPAHELRAVGDLSEALRLSPGLVAAYIQRAQAYVALAQSNTLSPEAREGLAAVRNSVARQAAVEAGAWVSADRGMVGPNAGLPGLAMDSMGARATVEPFSGRAKDQAERLLRDQYSKIEPWEYRALKSKVERELQGVPQSDRLNEAEELAYYRRSLIDYTTALRLDPRAPDSSDKIAEVRRLMEDLGTEIDTSLAVRPSDLGHPAAAPVLIAP